MKFSEGIATFVERKRASGLLYQVSEVTLSGFCKQIGDPPLEYITTHQVLTFLNGARTSTPTWRKKFSLLKLFFEYWSDRGAMPVLLMPQIRPRIHQLFIPYIFTRSELRDVLKAVPEVRKITHATIDEDTFRTVLLVLYGTGAMTGEVLGLKRQDVDCNRGMISFPGNRMIQARRIPINPDLRELLRHFLQSKWSKELPSAHIFVTNCGEPLGARRADDKFNRIRERVGISRDGGARFQPSMRDLRSTFAVHRIASWIRNRADLNRMLPALSAYMGLGGITSTERYLSLTPERFRKELNKLSPQRGKKHWRDDPSLMKFLAAL
jgi:integrase/recombinase XerD